ncbi:MAG TPA: PEGA domain-containing protein [Anaeromyxobacter sp.]|nr:PEGA domain-containing protein [Anaeromyxobacter sp.]
MSRLLAALLAAVLLAGAARADDAAEAKARFRKGADLYRAGRWREAIDEFEAAYRLKPHGAIHFNVAQCREKLAEWPGALRAYEDYLREVPDAKDRASVRASMRKIEERLAAAGVQALLVYTDPPGAELRLDGKARGKTPLHTVLPPGTYALALSLDGYEPVAEEVALALGASRVVDVVLKPARAGAAASAPAPPPALKAAPPSPQVPVAPAAASRPPQKRRVYTWIAAGAAAAAAATGAYFGWSASKDEDALASMTDPDGSQAQRYASGAESNARKANAMYAVAGAAAAAGVTLFFVEGKF